jgi:hypothetical protein
MQPCISVRIHHCWTGLDHGVGHLVSMTSQKLSDATAVRVETKKLPRHP